MNPGVDHYLVEGCGRCELGGTPRCKVHKWENELRELRRIILDCGLSEEVKWSQPCYTTDGKNVLILTAFKDAATLNIFKGVLIKDEHNLLESPGPNSQSARFMKFTDVNRVIELEPIIKDYIHQAVENEKAGLKVEFKKPGDMDLPEELLQKFEELPEFEKAFYSLTPGRQKGYILHFSGAKQSKTRENRIEKHMQRIFDGFGMHDR